MEKQDKQSEGLKLLKDIRTINRQIEELQELIDAVYTSLTNATVKPKEIQVQTSLPADPMADKVAMVVEYQKTLEDYQLSLVEKQMMANTGEGLRETEQRVRKSTVLTEGKN